MGAKLFRRSARLGCVWLSRPLFNSTETKNGFSFALSGRVSGDLDGRRPGLKPGIYNGIYETFDHSVQPWLYRATITKNFEADGSGLKSVRIGRQYHTGGDFLWFDGLEVHSLIPIENNSLDIAIFGGVPVRLYESSSNDWLAGGGASLRLDKVYMALEGYHIEEDARFGWVRKNTVGRFALDANLNEKINFNGVVRAVDDEEIDGRTRLTMNLPRNAIARLDYQFQSDDKSSHSTELDAYSIILGRSIGASRRGFSDFGGDIMVPLSDHLSFDIGASARDFKDSEDRNNHDFDRFFATLMLSDMKIINRSTDISITGEAYETLTDYTRAISGDVSMKYSKTVTLSAGTSYAIYSYGYATDQVKDDVRLGTAKITWEPKSNLRFNLRYDIEDDDYRLHHFISAGCRYAF